MKRIGVIGAGAVGGLVAGRLAAAGQEVVLFARGERLRALSRDGLRIVAPGEAVCARPQLVQSGDARPCDLLFVAVKAGDLSAAGEAIRAASHARTLVIPLINGLPHWYGRAGVRDLIGAVVFLRAELRSDGAIGSQGGERMVLGAIGETHPAEVEALAAMLTQAGVKAEAAEDLHPVLWTKLALNLATNPLSAVCGATLEEMARDPELSAVVRSALDETLALARQEGCGLDRDSRDLMAMIAQAGPFHTSMAQDLAAGRASELPTIADAVFNLADKWMHPMPVARALAAMARRRFASAARSRLPSRPGDLA